MAGVPTPVGGFGTVGTTPTAAAAFALPPLTTRPARPGRAVALFMIVWTTSAAEALGFTARTSAAIPATCGAAIEVPLNGT